MIKRDFSIQDLRSVDQKFVDTNYSYEQFNFYNHRLNKSQLHNLFPIDVIKPRFIVIDQHYLYIIDLNQRILGKFIFPCSEKQLNVTGDSIQDHCSTHAIRPVICNQVIYIQNYRQIFTLNGTNLVHAFDLPITNSYNYCEFCFGQLYSINDCLFVRDNDGQIYQYKNESFHIQKRKVNESQKFIQFCDIVYSLDIDYQSDQQNKIISRVNGNEFIKILNYESEYFLHGIFGAVIVVQTYKKYIAVNMIRDTVEYLEKEPKTKMCESGLAVTEYIQEQNEYFRKYYNQILNKNGVFDQNRLQILFDCSKQQIQTRIEQNKINLHANEIIIRKQIQNIEKEVQQLTQLIQKCTEHYLQQADEVCIQ
ncbi:Hypothetical_protein [Hexamita inflata]|uniref:Hypothetical_protein n=1 Tax=Hexamita inflata TaxID=28002 RepID=A0AA86U940_9EUKA|nr:Hypothetical protein HINF_LOCUS33704 [Hexamita inflata]